MILMRHSAFEWLITTAADLSDTAGVRHYRLCSQGGKKDRSIAMETAILRVVDQRFGQLSPEPLARSSLSDASA